MAQILHKCATTTHAIRAEIQQSQESIAVLSRRYHLNPKTVRKWRSRGTVEDAPMGPRNPRSKSMTLLQEAAAMAFRQKTWLPLDDCLHVLQRIMPMLTRSSLHRLYQRHGISRLPRSSKSGDETKFPKCYPLGCLRIDIIEVQTAESKVYLFVAIDRISKLVHAERYEQATYKHAADFLRDTLKALPYQVHTVLTDNTIPFAGKAGTEPKRLHPFDAVCLHHSIEHCLT